MCKSSKNIEVPDEKNTKTPLSFLLRNFSGSPFLMFVWKLTVSPSNSKLSPLTKAKSGRCSSPVVNWWIRVTFYIYKSLQPFKFDSFINIQQNGASTLAMQFRIYRWYDQGFFCWSQNMQVVLLPIPHLIEFVSFGNVLLRERMAKLKMFRGRWLMTLDHWLINLLSTNSHMDLITRLCKFNFTIINLSSDERFCCNTCWIELIVLNINSFRRFVDLTNIMIIGFSNSVSEWHLTLGVSCGW